MTNPVFLIQSLDNASFGKVIRFTNDNLNDTLKALESKPTLLSDTLNEAGGILVLPGLQVITQKPDLLLRLSYLFGAQVEDYTTTLSTRNMVHKKIPQILVMANHPPSNRRPPARPEPPLTSSGELPVQFPHRRGWHTDQSFRRPPPDITLFYAVKAVPHGEGQTLYADGCAAYDALAPTLREKADALQALHALPWTGRSESAVKAGETPVELLAHQRPQPQPIVRTHPVTGQRALYLCEDAQLDWLDGPIVGMSPGLNGDGAKLLYELMSHFTQRKFTYTHDWSDGDLVIHDNRNIIHSATWYDAEQYSRHMWRTTVMGNPGHDYEGEAPSWLPAQGVDPTANLPNQ